MSLLDNFPDTCNIGIRVKKSSDGMRGKGTAITWQQTNVACWLQQASSSEVNDFMQRGVRISHKIFFVADPSLQARSVIKMITRQNGVSVPSDERYILDVVSWPDPDASAGVGVLWKAMLVSQTASRDT